MKHFFTICLFVLPCWSWSQTAVTPLVVADLPSECGESSGIEFNSTLSLWTHNDSGDDANIYKIDTTGTLLRTVSLDGVTAQDIEDITQDGTNYYIGDFGNNNNDRDDLVIYKIPNPDSFTQNHIAPSEIHFSYPDQSEFPPVQEARNFDCESMFHIGNTLYLVSKNRGTSTNAKLYSLPDVPGTYVATLLDSFNTVAWVTGADISPNGQLLFLQSNSQFWVFTGYTGTDFFSGTPHLFSMPFTQKESVVFRNNSQVYMTDEVAFGLGGKLYFLDLSPYFTSIGMEQEVPQPEVFASLTDGVLDVNFRNTLTSIQEIRLMDMQGKIVFENRYSKNRTTRASEPIDFLAMGIYTLRVATPDGTFWLKVSGR